MSNPALAESSSPDEKLSGSPEVASVNNASMDTPHQDAEVIRGKKLAIVFSAFCLAFFLVALDQTILSTALPIITSHFNAVDDLSWIPSAYFLPQTAFMLLFGKLLTVLPAKSLFIVSVIIFEIGSLFCGVAPSVQFLIFGRAFAGLGGTGIWASILSIIARITTLEQRPVFLSFFGMVYAVSSIIGPILGGALSQNVTWRWCFYINLPIGGVAVVAVFFLLPHLAAPIESAESKLHRLFRLDWIGGVLNFGFVVFLLIALQYGGNEKPWNNSLVIAFLVLAAVFLVAFLSWEAHVGEDAILPFEVLARREVLLVSVASVFIFMCFVVFNYYLPLLYQVRGSSATHSGIQILPFMISGVLSNFTAGGFVSKTGIAWPILMIAPTLASVGFGVFYTVNEGTPSSRLFGLQLLVGIGLGCVTSLPLVVCQGVFADRPQLIPHATTFNTFAQLVGSSVGLAIGGAVFSSQLKEIVRSQGLPDVILVSVDALKEPGIPPQLHAAEVAAYVTSIQRVFLIGVPAAALAAIFACGLARKRLNKMENTNF